MSVFFIRMIGFSLQMASVTFTYPGLRSRWLLSLPEVLAHCEPVRPPAFLQLKDFASSPFCLMSGHCLDLLKDRSIGDYVGLSVQHHGAPEFAGALQLFEPGSFSWLSWLENESRIAENQRLCFANLLLQLLLVCKQCSDLTSCCWVHDNALRQPTWRSKLK